MKILNKLVRALILGCLIGLVGCVGLEPGYKSKRAKGALRCSERRHSLFHSVSIRNGLQKVLAKINGINPPYTIYLNQKLSLKNVSLTPLSDSGPNANDASQKKLKRKTQKFRKKRRAVSVDWSPLAAQWRTFGYIFIITAYQ